MTFRKLINTNCSTLPEWCAITLVLLLWVNASLAQEIAPALHQPRPSPRSGRATQAFDIAAVLRDEQALNEAHDVELQGQYAYVAGKGGSVAIVDVADPVQPRLVWSRRDAQLLHDAETVLLVDGRLFLGSDDLHSIDVSAPRQPVFDATLVDRGRIHTINGMVLRGDTLIAASKEGFLTAIDVSTPAAPRIAGVIDARQQFGVQFPHDVDLYGAYAVVVDPNGFGPAPGSLALFRVFDDAGRLLPDSQWTMAGRIDSETLTGANRVQVRGDRAYVGGSWSPKASGGRPLAKGSVVDLSDPALPRIIVSVALPRRAWPQRSDDRRRRLVSRGRPDGAGVSTSATPHSRDCWRHGSRQRPFRQPTTTPTIWSIATATCTSPARGTTVW